ncbi:MAG: hypothetical protein COT00_01225, partial [Candidatus Omnitrophica bacterium CG07_land_8_20_14_0_80_50_8]
AVALLDEMRAIEARLASVFMNSADERKLIETSRAVELIKKLIHLELTSDEYARLNENPAFSDAVAMSGFLNRKLMDLHSHYEDALFLDEDYDKGVAAARHFYELTLERDRAFLDRLVAKMQKEGETKAVLIAGGYHAFDLEKLFRDRRIAYTTVRPQVLQETNKARYERLLLGRRFVKNSGGSDRNISPEVARGLQVPVGSNTWASVFSIACQRLGATPGARLRNPVIPSEPRFQSSGPRDLAAPDSSTASLVPNSSTPLGMTNSSGARLADGPDHTSRRTSSEGLERRGLAGTPIWESSKFWKRRFQFLEAIRKRMNPDGTRKLGFYIYAGPDVVHPFLALNLETLIMTDQLVFGQGPTSKASQAEIAQAVYEERTAWGERLLENYVTRGGGNMRSVVLASLRSIEAEDISEPVNISEDTWEISFRWKHPSENDTRERKIIYIGSRNLRSLGARNLPEPVIETIRNEGGVDFFIEKAPNYYGEAIRSGIEEGPRPASLTSLANLLKRSLVKEGGYCIGDEETGIFLSSGRDLVRHSSDFSYEKRPLLFRLKEFFSFSDTWKWGNGPIEVVRRHQGAPDILSSGARLAVRFGDTHNVPLGTLLETLRLEETKLVSDFVEPGSGLRVLEIKVENFDGESLSPKGPNILRELFYDIRLDSLNGRSIRFYVVLSEDNLPLGIFPVPGQVPAEDVLRLGRLYVTAYRYWNLTPFLTPLEVIKNLGPESRRFWLENGQRLRDLNEKLEKFKSFYLQKLRDARELAWVGEPTNPQPFIYAEFNPADRKLRARSFNPDVIGRLDEGQKCDTQMFDAVDVPRTLLVRFPSTYDFSGAVEADEALYQEVYDRISSYVPADDRSGNAVVVGNLCAGLGTIAWIDYLALGQRAKTARFHVSDINPLASASARFNLGQVIGIPNLEVTTNDNLISPEGYQAFSERVHILTANAPDYDSSHEGFSGTPRAVFMTELADGREHSVHFWNRFIEALPRWVDPDRGLVLVWNSISSSRRSSIPERIRNIPGVSNCEMTPDGSVFVLNFGRALLGARMAKTDFEPRPEEGILLEHSFPFGRLVVLKPYEARPGLLKYPIDIDGDVTVSGELTVVDPVERQFLVLGDDRVRRYDYELTRRWPRFMADGGMPIQDYFEAAVSPEKYSNIIGDKADASSGAVIYARNLDLGHFWDPDSFFVVWDGEGSSLLAKPEDARGLRQAYYEPLNGQYFVTSLDAMNPGIYPVEVENGRLIGSVPFKNGFKSVPLLMNGQDQYPKIFFKEKEKREPDGAEVGRAIYWENPDQTMAFSAMGNDRSGKFVSVDLAKDWYGVWPSASVGEIRQKYAEGKIESALDKGRSGTELDLYQEAQVLQYLAENGLVWDLGLGGGSGDVTEMMRMPGGELIIHWVGAKGGLRGLQAALANPIDEKKLTAALENRLQRRLGAGLVVKDRGARLADAAQMTDLDQMRRMQSVRDRILRYMSGQKDGGIQLISRDGNFMFTFGLSREYPGLVFKIPKSRDDGDEEIQQEMTRMSKIM